MIKFTVKVMLAKREMTQQLLAAITGIRPPTISAICTGAVKHLPIEALNKICDALNCQPGDIIEYVPDADRIQRGFGAAIPNMGDIVKIDGDKLTDKTGKEWDKGLVNTNQALGGDFELCSVVEKHNK